MSHSMLKLDRRKKVVIEGALQRRIVLSVCLPMVAVLAVVLLLQMGVDQAIRAGTLDVDGKILGMPERTLSAILFFVFATAWQLIHVLKVSHRIAGAMHRMRTVLQAYRAGDPDARIRLRKNDLQLELASEINATLDWVAGEAGQAFADRSATDETPDAVKKAPAATV
ncbi:MAG: hypothetical protein HKN12_02510 [Gemmatimonadetes bacterium]|nr:hypothetical protein [Gemmatimonadota bacterium]